MHPRLRLVGPSHQPSDRACPSATSTTWPSPPSLPPPLPPLPLLFLRFLPPLPSPSHLILFARISPSPSSSLPSPSLPPSFPTKESPDILVDTVAVMAGSEDTGIVPTKDVGTAMEESEKEGGEGREPMQRGRGCV